MRLIVGPLPAAVYWRRRAVVFVGLAMVVMVFSYACGGPDTVAGAGANPTQSSGAATPAQTVLHPTVLATSATPKATAFVLPTPGITGPCMDDEIELTASAASTEATRGHTIDVTIQIRNVSGRTCSRDIGADVQELKLQDATTTLWSTDDCNPNTGHDVRSFPAGKKVSFTLTWSGRRSRTGTGALICTPTAPAPAPAVYQLVARLGQKVSLPFALHIVA